MTKRPTSMASQPKKPAPNNFLTGGGKMGELIRDHDWAQTSLSALSQWPQSLRTAVNIILHSPLPMAILWGEDGIMLYNDAYSDFAGARHPQILGSKVVEGWPEVADFNRHVMAKGLSGQTLSYKDQRLTLFRNHVAEEVWMDLNYSPIMNEAGQPAGVIAIVVETTDRIQASQKQHQAEAELQAERNRLHDLLQHAPAAIAILNGPQLTFQFANPRYRQLLGKDRPLDGIPLIEAIPEIEPSILEIVKTVAFKGERFVANELPLTLDWDYNDQPYIKYLNFIYEPTIEDGKPNGLIAFAYDVTDQVAARKEAEQQSRVLEMMASGAPLSDTLDFLIRSIEQQTASGLKGSILLLDKLGAHLLHGAAPSLPQAYNEAIDGIEIGPNMGSCGTAAFTQKPVIVSDISTDPLWAQFKDLAAVHNIHSCWSTPIFSPDHTVLGTFAMYYGQPHVPSPADRHIIDFVTRTAAIIIERKRAEEALKESEERFRFMAETLPLKIFITDALGTITYFNPQWSEYTGASMEQLLRDRVLKFLHPDDLEMSMASWRRALQDGAPLQNEQRLRRHDGEYRRHISHVRAMRDRTGKIISWFGSMTDIEDALQTVIQKEKLELITTGLKEQRVQLMAISNAKDEFISLASHQLRTPATAVKQYISMLMGGYGGTLSLPQTRFLQKAYDSNERQLDIIKDLLKTAQIDSNRYALRKELQPISPIVRTVVEETQPTIELKNQTLVFHSHDDSARVVIDRHEMKVVFANLIENASKYSRPGATISVNLHRTPKHVEIDITDAGVGLSADNLSRVFEKFTRIDNELSDTVTGSGLGLYWVKKIVKLHHGTIKVHSVLGEGSTFTVRLPL